MARSKEAIRRRAQKRNRSVQEQQKVDWQTHQKQLGQREEQERSRSKLGFREDGGSSLSKDTANPLLMNHGGTTSDGVIVNDMSESSNGAAEGSPVSSLWRRQSSHTASTTPTNSPSWKSQADARTMEANRRLREVYLKTGGVGMSQVDQERALILMARDKRKQEKKQRQKHTKKTEKPPKFPNKKQETIKLVSMETNSDKHALPNKIVAAESKLARQRNKALRKRYRETSGEGMTQEERERAKILLDRDARKKQTRHALANDNDKSRADGKLQSVSSDTKNGKTIPVLASIRDDKKARKALRKLFKKTKGEGMTFEEQEKAKILIERHSKKREKRAAERDEKSRKRAKR